MVSIYLRNLSNTAIKIDYSVSIIDGCGKQVVYKQTKTPNHFGPAGRKLFLPKPGQKWPDFAKRSTLMNSLVDGALVIKVNMRWSLHRPSSFQILRHAR
jgi:hypothetical protein